MSRADKGFPGGRPPDVHPLWHRLESPLSTYYLLLGTIAMLLSIGLLMVLSASSVKQASMNQSLFAVFLKQAQFAAVGLLGAFVASRLPISFWRRISVPLLGGAVLAQLLVFTPLGTVVNGNRNWLSLGPVQLQPSEFGKVALIVYGATVLSAKRRMLGRWRHALVPLVFPAGALLVGLVLLGRDLGTSLVLLAVLIGVLWAAGVSARLFLAAGAGCALLVGALVAFSGNRTGRLSTWLGCDDVHKCWQTSHGKAALAEGGLGGVGLGGGRQKWGWLPEAHNDFIFAVIGEELGIAGTLTVLALFALLALACYRIVLHSGDMFVRVATAGVMVWILVQAAINIGSVIGMVPVVGLPLPLVSSGGSALMTTLAALGMVVSFARAEPACRRALAARPSLLTRSLTVWAARRSPRPALED